MLRHLGVHRKLICTQVAACWSSATTMIRVHDIKWDAARKKWYCVHCQRTSAYAIRADAIMELGEFECVKGVRPPRPSRAGSTVKLKSTLTVPSLVLPVLPAGAVSF